MSVVGALVLIIIAFCAMEGVSYALHRWVMHGAGMRLHSSHHRPSKGGWEANDAFPLMFSVFGVALFLLATVGPRIHWLFWIAVGVTAYGLAYLVVHELVIHRRLAVRLPASRYTTWLRESHRIHHLYGSEPFGMLLPVVDRRLRDRASADSQGDELKRRASARETRARL